MGAAVPIRTDISAGKLRRLARQETDGRVACRLFGVANALDGMSRERAWTARRSGIGAFGSTPRASTGCGIGPRAAARPGSTTASWRRSRRWSYGARIPSATA